MAVTALIRIKCHAGKGGQLREALSVPMQLTRENPQCSRIELLGPSDDADDFVLLEDWSSEDEHTKHVERLTELGALNAANAVMADVQAPHYARENAPSTADGTWAAAAAEPFFPRRIVTGIDAASGKSYVVSDGVPPEGKFHELESAAGGILHLWYVPPAG
eukprot:COSAG04_NODE_10803_length_752_cov_0.872894_1_plen_161_part_01